MNIGQPVQAVLKGVYVNSVELSFIYIKKYTYIDASFCGCRS